ncbi:unnamed protein product, partial [Rotaria sp. Silwood2]
GARHRDELKERLKSILKEIKKFNGGIMLFIDQIDLLFDVENQKPRSIDTIVYDLIGGRSYTAVA